MILKELYVSSDRIFKSWKYLFSRPVHSDTREKKIDLYPIFTAEERNWKVREWSVRINVWLGLLGTKTWRVQINWRLLGLPRRNVIPGSGPVICPPVGGALSVTWHVQWNWAASVWPRRGRRTSWTREEEKGVAVVTSVKCREMKVTFTPTTETETYCLNHYSKAVIELRPKYHCESCHTDVCRECFMRKCLSHDVNWVGNKQFRCVSPFHVHQK